jgi:predicted transcriptional regulator
MENPSEKNKKFLKALNLAKTLKTTTNLNEEQMPEKITFSYTDPGFSFYKMYYSVNKQRKKLRSVGEANQFLKTLGIEEEVPRRYNETILDKIVKQLESKGIEADHNAFMDVS